MAVSSMWSFVAASCALFSLCSATASAHQYIVDTGYAKYLGNHSAPNTVAYLGVPYAEPPVGDLRFRATVALDTKRVAEAETTGGVVNATAYPEFCIQGTIGAGDAGGAGSEDCLKVNIYAPTNATADSKLPVLVYIHGGGYYYGNPRNWPFDAWVNQSPNVVIVSVYYRLDSLGFLAHPDFQTDPTLGDLNTGFQDQIQALKWIQQYISAFGGDPSKVTINGESAGGSSIELHLLAGGGTEELFSGAIAQSVYRVYVSPPEQKLALWDFYTTEAGCPASASASGESSVATQMACLRKASVSAIARAQDAAFYNTNLTTRLFIPVIDGKVIEDYPVRLIEAGKFRKVPLIVGSTSNETLSGGTDIPTALESFFPAMNPTTAAEFLTYYPLSEFDSASQQFQVATGESELICARALLGGAWSEHVNTWTYRYNQPNPTSGSDSVGHAAENWMMFDGSNTGTNGSAVFTGLDPVEQSFADELIAYWLSFVRAADPNTYKLSRSPEWPQYSAQHKNRVVLQQDPQNSTTASGSYIELEPTEESARCEFVVGQVVSEQN